ncbi:helix-turn-helix transcriptional regulator [Alteraurantiacibacter aestuarii]|uniref:Helix-turn-helix domain-containing protein n=1 Tax=Alteraurantiacibacter aestuarii TaxID=650004 RepID=A0A844ZJV4_9SPHN|nr:helix-turn-helix transcriptional regulator [Alteraurantiacibacter aestuarii]MXO87552.1 helix-turn-helix domain-containing protein [Alteraurantiacibacter aestuarii]
MGKAPPITNRVRDLREAHGGMSQQALADAIGVTRQTVIAIELGKYSPSLESAFRIARTFGVGVEDVFGWEG